MPSKTVFLGMSAVEYHGGFLERFVSKTPILPGVTIMVPDDIYAVLVAGEKATTVFDVGPHELDLMMFNRQPSGLLYVMPSIPYQLSWYPQGTSWQRHLELKVADPLLFVQQFVVNQKLEEEHGARKVITDYADKLIAQMDTTPDVEKLRAGMGPQLADCGLSIVDYAQNPAGEEKKKEDVVPDKDVLLTPEDTLPEPASINITQVWASSTMDLIGKGELTLKVHVVAAESTEMLDRREFKYDKLVEYKSPDNWLAAKTWQDLPKDSLFFGGIDPKHHVRMLVVAEERDPGSTDSLGQLLWNAGLPCGPFEIGPTQGGKKGQFVKIKGTFQ